MQTLKKTSSYYDNNCQDYAGSASPGLDEVVGGPAGSFSMLWVDATDPCYVFGVQVRMLRRLLIFNRIGYLWT